MSLPKISYKPPSSLPASLRNRADWYRATHEQIINAFEKKENLAAFYGETKGIVPVQYAYAEAILAGFRIQPEDYRYHAHDQSAAVTTYTRAFNPTGVQSDWSSTDGSEGTNMFGTTAGALGNEEVKIITGFGINIEPAVDADIRLALREGISRFKKGDTILWSDRWEFLPVGTGVNQDSANGVPVLTNRNEFFDRTTGTMWGIRIEGNEGWRYEYLRATAFSAATWVTHYMFGPYLFSN